MEENASKHIANGDNTQTLNENDFLVKLWKLKSSYQNVFKDMPPTIQKPQMENSRKLFLMRHGERVDFTFGDWMPHCFSKNGKYIQKDLNMPKTLPRRSSGRDAYVYDGPLTNIGLFQAQLVGEAMKDDEVDISHVYCSPALRSIQTCDAVLRGYGKKDEVKIKVEPGLFEWVIWYPHGKPTFMTPVELVEAGYNIDLSYQPYVTDETLRQSRENCEQLYLRGVSVVRKALEDNLTGNVLCVGHSCTLEVCSRELIGEKPKPLDEMIKIIQKIPYCGIIQLSHREGKWAMDEPPFPPLTHTENHRFNYNFLRS